MIERLSPGKRNLALAVVLALMAWFAWSIRSVVNPLLLGYLCAYILHPVVLRIEGLGFSRRTAVNLTFATGFVLSVVVSLVLALQMRSLALEVYRSAREASSPSGEPATLPDASGSVADAKADAPAGPHFAERLEARLEEFRLSLEEMGLEGIPPIPVSMADLKAEAGTLLTLYGEDTAALGVSAAEHSFSFLSRLLRRVVSLGGMFLLLPLYTYYFLFVQKDVHGFVRRYLPKRDRERLSRTAGSIGEVIANFFRGRLTVCVLKGAILSLGLWVTDVPYALLFGMLSGFLSVIPVFGPFIGFVLALLVAVLDHGVVSALLRTGVVFGVGEMLEGYVLVPKVLGDSLGLHPLVVFVALLAGGASLGMLGVLVALPLTASCVILIKEFVLPALRDFADEDSDPSSG